MRRRSAEVARAARDKKNHPPLRARVAELQRLYRDAYTGDRVLTTIALNVLEEALAQLR